MREMRLFAGWRAEAIAEGLEKLQREFEDARVDIEDVLNELSKEDLRRLAAFVFRDSDITIFGGKLPAGTKLLWCTNDCSFTYVVGEGQDEDQPQTADLAEFRAE